MLTTVKNKTTKSGEYTLNEKPQYDTEFITKNKVVDEKCMTSEEFWGKAKIEFDKICKKYGIL